MDYQKLIGKVVTLNKNEVHVDSIREMDGLFSNHYEVNNEYTYSSNAIFGAILDLEAKERQGQNLGFFAKLLSRFGVFLWKRVHTNEVRICSLLGVRKYGYHKCSVFAEMHVGKACYVFEFVFNDKERYREGIYPCENVSMIKLL